MDFYAEADAMPTHAEAGERYGEYAYEDGALDQAIQHYARVLRDWPQGGFADPSLYGIGWARFGKQEWSGAAEAMTELLERHPPSQLAARGRYVRAMAYQQLGQFEPARNEQRRISVGTTTRHVILSRRGTSSEGSRSGQRRGMSS